jgi:hypothetical protein
LIKLSVSTVVALALLTSTIGWLAMRQAAFTQAVAIAQVSGSVTDPSSIILVVNNNIQINGTTSLVEAKETSVCVRRPEQARVRKPQNGNSV